MQRENADLKKQLLEVKKETMELKKPLSQWRVSLKKSNSRTKEYQKDLSE